MFHDCSLWLDFVTRRCRWPPVAMGALRIHGHDIRLQRCSYDTNCGNVLQYQPDGLCLCPTISDNAVHLYRNSEGISRSQCAYASNGINNEHITKQYERIRFYRNKDMFHCGYCGGNIFTLQDAIFHLSLPDNNASYKFVRFSWPACILGHIPAQCYRPVYICFQTRRV